MLKKVNLDQSILLKLLKKSDKAIPENEYQKKPNKKSEIIKNQIYFLRQKKESKWQEKETQNL